MKKLEINITQAALKSFSVSMPTESGAEPVVSATISLLTDGGKEITTYSISTESWQEKDRFTLPMNAYMPLSEIAKILEGVVVRHCRDGQKGITANSESTEEATDDPVEIVDIDDAPIDLSKIKF